jgi:hypothetical protein
MADEFKKTSQEVASEIIRELNKKKKARKEVTAATDKDTVSTKKNTDAKEKQVNAIKELNVTLGDQAQSLLNLAILEKQDAKKARQEYLEQTRILHQTQQDLIAQQKREKIELAKTTQARKTNKQEIIDQEKVRKQELAELKKAIINRKRQASVLERILLLNKKLADSQILGVRNQRNLNFSLSRFRSQLLIASFGIATLQKLTNTLVGEYADYEAAQNRVNSTLKSTGFASLQTVKSLSNLSSEIQKTTGVSDTLILNSSALLATFTQISGETFPEAQKAIVDMTAAMNAGNITQEGLKSSTIQLGKALNNPIKGLTALSRVGVRFTSQQKEQIKTLVNSGKVTEAQAVILAELNKEFGGSASADTYEKSLRSFESAVGDLQKEIGVALLPTIKRIVDSLAEFISKADPATMARYATSIGIVASNFMALRKAVLLVNSAMLQGVSATVALRTALFSMTKGGIVGLALVGLTFLSEKVLELFGVFDNLGGGVQRATNRFIDLNNAVVTMFPGLGSLPMHISASEEGLDKLDKVTGSNVNSLRDLESQLENLNNEYDDFLKFGGAGGGDSEAIYEQQIQNILNLIAAHEEELLTIEILRGKILEYLDARDKGNEQTTSEEIDKLTKKYQDQVTVLKQVNEVNRELTKIALEQGLGKDTLINALEDEESDYHDLATAIKESIELKRQEANENKFLAESMSFLTGMLSSESQIQQEIMRQDIENVRNTSKFKLAQKRGDEEAMLKMEKDAAKKSFASRKATFIAGKALAAADVVIKYQQAIAKGFADGGAVFGIPLALAMKAQMAMSLALIAKQAFTEMPKFAKGGDFVTSGPQMIMVGDNPGGRERVQVTPLSSPNIAGPQGASVTVNVSGNVLSQDFVEGELAEQIKDAIRRGTDFGIN